MDTSSVSSVLNIYFRLDFFNDLYHRFLITAKPDMKAMCLQVYKL